MCNYPSETNKDFRILSVCGGGVRGLFAAKCVNEIHEKIGINIHDSFDLFAGTSTGALIAASLAANKSPELLTNIYKDNADRIFGHKNWFSCSGLIKAKFKSAHLEKKLKDIFRDTKIGDLDKPLIIPVTSLKTGSPLFYKSQFKGVGIPRDKNFLLREILLAATAAPSFFKPVLVDCLGELQADGGLFMNDPTLAAILEAYYIHNVPLERIKVIRIGTEYNHCTYSNKDSKKSWGILSSWNPKKMLELILNLQVNSTLNMTNYILKKSPAQFINIDAYDEKKSSLDDTSDLVSLEGMAVRTVGNKLAELESFFNS